MFAAIISGLGSRGLGVRVLVVVVAVAAVTVGVYERGRAANAGPVQHEAMRGEPVFVLVERQRQAAADRAMVMAEQAREREDNLPNPTYATYSADVAARDLAMVMAEREREGRETLQDTQEGTTQAAQGLARAMERQPFERELILMEAAGLVTLNRSHLDRLTSR